MASLLRGLFRFLLFLMALAFASLALAAQGGVFSDRLDVLTHFAPFYLAGAAAVAAAWGLLVRRGFLTMALAAAAVISSGLLMAPEYLAPRSPAAAADAPRLKLIQFNLWGRNDDVPGTVAWILAQNADVIVLEEAGGAASAVPESLAGAYPYRTICAKPRYCPSLILSRRPPIAEGSLNSLFSETWLSGAWATLPGPGGPFTVIGAHFTWPWPAGPQQQMTLRLAKVLKQHPHDSAIVSGDFNSTPWSFSLRRQDALFGLERRTRALPSWPAATSRRVPAPFPILPIDHVYAGPAWRTVSVERGPRLGSDHYPVVVTLARVSPPAPAAPPKAAR